MLSNLFELFIFKNEIAVKFKWISSRTDTGMAFMVGMIIFGVPSTCHHVYNCSSGPETS